MEKNLEISEKSVVSAYNSASEEQKQVLVGLFGADIFKPKSVMDRIKTFEDAVEALGEEHPFVVAYRQIEDIDECGDDIEAYLKLRIIVAALNEGWTPKFEKDEWRYYPWFWLYTNGQIEEMNEEEKAQVCRVVGRASGSASAGGGLVCSYAYDVSTYSSTSNGSRLAFKTEELAEYAGKQFIEIYRDFMIVE